MAEFEKQQFSSVQEEISHWRDLAVKYKSSYESVKEELDDFQASSRELEVELEAQLTQAESKNRELTSINSRLQTEVESLKEKLEMLQSTSYRQMSDLETQLAKAEAYSDRMQKYVRELEQTNDDLERAKRAAVVSLEDFEGRLNLAIERNAFLEGELDEKENLVVCVQRLKDEARDLRHELAVHHKRDEDAKSDNEMEKMDVTSSVPKVKPVLVTPSGDSVETRVPEPALVKMEPGTPARESFSSKTPEATKLRVESSANSARNSSFMMASPITPATRISALNIVSDLLRKVGALESKLNSCRGVANGQQQSGLRNRERNSPGSVTNSPSLKRVSMGAALPRASPAVVGQTGYVQITV